MVCAMVDKKTNSQSAKKMVSYDDWPKDGRWIVQVTYGEQDRVAQKAQAAHNSLNTANKKEFKIYNSFKSKNGLNALVLEGLSIEDIKSMPGVMSVSPDIPVYADEYSWGIDRSDQRNLPLDQATYSPAFAGCGVDVYLLDTGLDAGHAEFSDSGNGRLVQNIWNGFGDVTANTDGNGHGSHCGGRVNNDFALCFYKTLLIPNSFSVSLMYTFTIYRYYWWKHNWHSALCQYFRYEGSQR